VLKLTEEFHFDAAHDLPNYIGKCHNLHGHRWKLLVTISGHVDEKTGMIMDFKDLKNVVEENVLQYLDHAYLNDVIENPTAENIVQWIAKKLVGVLPLYSLKLYESPESYVEWEKGE
jgi:6-pyruvoyltetrahydropterin/6-carboxytetrahydropterin synthase